MKWAAAVVLSGCVCVADPTDTFMCKSDSECVDGTQCIAGWCLKGRPDGGCLKMTGGLAVDCLHAECAGQPCLQGNGNRGMCCGDACIEPGEQGNCGGCGLVCPGGTCTFYSSVGISPPFVTGFCIGCPMTCPKNQTCGMLPSTLGPACLCHTDSDCMTGEACLIRSGSDGVCWYPP